MSLLLSRQRFVPASRFRTLHFLLPAARVIRKNRRRTTTDDGVCGLAISNVFSGKSDRRVLPYRFAAGQRVDRTRMYVRTHSGVSRARALVHTDESIEYPIAYDVTTLCQKPFSFNHRSL